MAFASPALNRKTRLRGRDAAARELARAPPPVSDPRLVKKNPTRLIPDQNGFSALSKQEVKKDTREIDKHASFAALAETDSEDEREIMSEILSMQPSVSAESELNKKKRRMIAWATDPSAMETEIESYHALVENSRRELSFVEGEAERWKYNFELARHKVSSALAEGKRRNQQLGDDARQLLQLCLLETGKSLDADGDGGGSSLADVAATAEGSKKRGMSSLNASNILHKTLQELSQCQDVFSKSVREYEQLVSASSLVDINAAPVISITLDEKDMPAPTSIPGAASTSALLPTSASGKISQMVQQEEEKMMSRIRSLQSWLPMKEENEFGSKKKSKKTTKLWQPGSGADRGILSKSKAQSRKDGKEKDEEGTNGKDKSSDAKEGINAEEDGGEDDGDDEGEADESLEALSEMIFAMHGNVRDAENSLYDLSAFFPDDDGKSSSKAANSKGDEVATEGTVPEYHGIFGKSVLQQYGIKLVKKGEQGEKNRNAEKGASLSTKTTVKVETKPEKGKGKKEKGKKQEEKTIPLPKDPSKEPPRLFDYSAEYSVVSIPPSSGINPALVTGKEQEKLLAKKVLSLKSESQWAQHMEDMCRAPTNGRRKRKAVSQVVPVPLTSHATSRTPTGVPLLVSPLSQYEDRFVGVLNGKQVGKPVPHTKEDMDKKPCPAKEEEHELGLNAGVEEARVQNAALLPPELEEAENTIMNYCQLLTYAAAMETDIRRLMNTSSEWRKQASEVSYNTLWSENAYHQVQMEDYTETRLNRKELIAKGRFEGENLPMSPIRSGSFLHLPGVPIKGYTKAGPGHHTKKKILKPHIPGQKTFCPPGAAAAMKQHAMGTIAHMGTAGSALGQHAAAAQKSLSPEAENGVSDAAREAAMLVAEATSAHEQMGEDEDAHSVVSLEPPALSSFAGAGDWGTSSSTAAEALADTQMDTEEGSSTPMAEGGSSVAGELTNGDHGDEVSEDVEGEGDEEKRGRRSNGSKGKKKGRK